MDLLEGQSVHVQGSGGNVYTLEHVRNVYSCTCPAWKNQKLAIEQRTCKHLRAHLGEAHENERVGRAVVARPAPKRPSVGEDSERRAERRAALQTALERFPSLHDRMEEVYGLRMPKHLAYAMGFWMGLDRAERSEAWAYLGNGPAGVGEWFLDGMIDRNVKPGLDERLQDRFRCDPPEMVTIFSGNSDGGHWGLWYDDPSELPRTVVMNYARDDAETHACERTLLASLREGMVRDDGEMSPEEWPHRANILSWLDEALHGERLAHAKENIPNPLARPEHRVGGYASLAPGYVVPADEQKYDASRQRYDAYRARAPVVREWIAHAVAELAAGRPGPALMLGRELHWVDADEYRDDGAKMLIGAYRALDRHALAEIMRVHHEHRDLQSVHVYDPPTESAFSSHVSAGDLDALRKDAPTKSELASALGRADVAVLTVLLERPEARALAGNAVAERIGTIKEFAEYPDIAGPNREAVLTLLRLGGASGKGFTKAFTSGEETLAKAAVEHADLAWRSESGASVLHVAARLPSIEAVRKLLDRGADPKAKDANGKTAYDAARDAWQRDQRTANAIFELLGARGGGPEAPPPPAAKAWAPGGRVTHVKFGDGTIEAVAGEGDEAKLTIAFGVGKKTLLAKFVTKA
jgi:hypothetical protein